MASKSRFLLGATLVVGLCSPAALAQDYVGKTFPNFKAKVVNDGEMFSLEDLRGQVVLVEMVDRTVQLASATSMIAVPHTKIDPFANQVFTTYAAEVQQIKVDSKGNTGIRHLTQ